MPPNHSFVSYCITDPQYFTRKNFQESLKRFSPDFVCFRDKTGENILQKAKEFLQIAKAHSYTNTLINGEIELAKRLDFMGVHLRSNQLDTVELCKKEGLFVVASCHNETEIQKALHLGADMITYSPIFATPNKGTPKGVENLQATVEKYPLPIVALGGITTKKQVEQIKDSGAYGFASIRYFVEAFTK